MIKSIKFWVIEGLILWPFLSMSLFLVTIIFKPNPYWFESWDITLTAILYYTLLSMYHQFFLYLLSVIVMICLRSIFNRFSYLTKPIYALFFGAVAGIFSYVLCQWLNKYVIGLYESIFDAYHYIYGFALIGGLFFLLGLQEKRKSLIA